MISEKELEELARKKEEDFKKLLKDAEPELLIQAVHLLTRMSEEDPLAAEKYAALLMDLLDHENDGVRSGAIAALATLGDSIPQILKPGVDKFQKLLQDRNLNVRRNAAYALALVGEEEPELVKDAIKELVHTLKTGEDIVRANAACSLALFARGNPKTVVPFAEEFIHSLNDENEVVKTNSIYIVGHIGKEDIGLVRDIIPKLIEYLHGDPILKENAAYALALIGIRDPELIKDAVPLLLELLRDAREEVRATSACALGATCNPEALKSLQELISDSSLVNIYHPEGRVFIATTVSEMARQAKEKAKHKR